MGAEFDIRSAVAKYTELGFGRLRIVRNLADLRLEGMRAGVLFVFAVWSGPAVMALRRITRLLSTIELGSLDVVVIDNDCMTGDGMIRLFGHVFHGGGETLWVREGRVVAELLACKPDTDPLILSHTQSLLNQRQV